MAKIMGRTKRSERIFELSFRKDYQPVGNKEQQRQSFQKANQVGELF